MIHRRALPLVLAFCFGFAAPNQCNRRKLMDSKRINSLGWQSKTGLEEGLKIAYQDFQENGVS